MTWCIALLISGLLTAASLAEAAPLYVAVGYGGRRASSRDGVTWEHDQRWSDEAKDDDNVLFNIAYGLDRFVAVGGGAKIGHILTTRDGKEWKELPQVKGRVATVAFGNGRFVAGHDAELLWSTNGEQFHPGEKLGLKGSVHARKSTFGDGEGGAMFVIIGDVDLHAERKRVGWRATTMDGEMWSSQAVDTPEARDIAYGSGHFVIVGPKGLIESSHDGQNWTRRETPLDEDFHNVVWTGQRFLAKGKKLWTSPDGIHWSPEEKSIPCGPEWARENVGGIGFSWGGSVFFSADLKDWKKVPVAPGPSFTAVAANR
jgi:hypothetical protein